MQAFKNLRITDPYSSRSNLINFMEILRNQQHDGWLFLEDKARDYAKNIFKDYREVAVFGSPEICKRTVTVWLILEGVEVRISNIVPNKQGRLSYNEYNSIFDEFLFHIIRPVAEKARVNFLTTAPEIHLSQLIGLETYDKLII